MRKQIAALVLLLAVGAPRAALPLEAKNTMADWFRASDTERSALLDALQAKSHKPAMASRMAILACMNRAAEAEGHSAVRIDEMVQACAEPMRPDDAAPGETRI